MKYTQIPTWLKKQDRDPFAYQLRSKEEVAEDHKLFPPTFQWQAQMSMYPSGDIRENEEDRLDHRDKKAKMVFDMSKMGLSPQQRERMIFLLGPRYNAKKGNIHEFKIVCDHFPSYQENFMRVMEQFREIYWESLRAPAECATLYRNPYRREKLLKKMFGHTREERAENRKLMSAKLKEHIN